MFKLAKNIQRHIDKIQSFTHKYLIRVESIMAMGIHKWKRRWIIRWFRFIVASGRIKESLCICLQWFGILNALLQGLVTDNREIRRAAKQLIFAFCVFRFTELTNISYWYRNCVSKNCLQIQLWIQYIFCFIIFKSLKYKIILNKDKTMYVRLSNTNK